MSPLNLTLTNGLDFDLLRLSPVDAQTSTGIPLSYPAVVPAISQFANTTVEAENFDKGGIGVGYSDNWSSGGLASFRAEEQVATVAVGQGHAARGSAGRWLHFNVDVKTPGQYLVEFSASNAGGAATALSLRNAADDTLIGDVTVPATGGFGNFSTVQFAATFATTGRKTLRLRFTTGETQVDWLRFTPTAMSLIGPQMPPPAPPQSQSAGTIKHVGTVFAVNAVGTINKLRYYVNTTELLYSQDNNLAISLRLWRITSATQVLSTGQITYVTDPTPVAGPVTLQLSGAQQGGWFTAGLTVPEGEVQPGLYMVSANVNTSYSISEIPLGATPGALTLVAGSVGNESTPNTYFPESVFRTPSYPTAYLWMDVVFNPSY